MSQPSRSVSLPSSSRRPWRLGALAAIALAAALALDGRASAAVDKRELQAREDFAAGRYQEALEIFAKLYAEKLHPNYLRNIGRCYQNLGDPDKAISAFREYLRKARAISPDERAEVEGYIKEMEELAARRQPPPAAPLAPAAPPEPPPRLPTPTAPAPAPALTLTATPPRAPAPAPAPAPFYTRWWFWTLVGGAALVGGLAAAGVFTTRKDAACGAPPWSCQ
jgi:Tetratricopeptide repeat